ncbi:MAG TPA: hypothetical protein EYG03_22005 [Planctomycetes bacterium]|nr:hypothetical protein [Fuerstiella sp.]HIK94628.1 hypothetical protein [Planctomycetota bacterium]
MSTSIMKSNDADDESGPVTHRVVVFDVHEDPETLERILTSMPGMDRTSARKLLHSLPGIIPRPMSRNAAAVVANSIRRLGLNSAAIPSGEIPDLCHAEQTHHLRITDELLEVVDIDGTQHSWPWQAVAVLSVGVVPSTAPARHRPASTLSQGSSHRSWNDGVTLPARSRAEAFLVLNADQPVFTFASDEMNYECLGSRMTGSSKSNFRQLIKDLMARSATARVTPSTRVFLDRSPVRHYEFRTRDEFRRYTEFQTLLSGRSGVGVQAAVDTSSTDRNL